MKDAGEFIGIGVMVLCICIGLSYCRRTDAEIKQMQKPPAVEPAK